MPRQASRCSARNDRIHGVPDGSGRLRTISAATVSLMGETTNLLRASRSALTTQLCPMSPPAPLSAVLRRSAPPREVSRPRESLCGVALSQHDRTVPATRARLTYRSLFAIREFRVLFLNRCVVVISVAASGLALATITYEATRSAVLTRK
jgi:hypothetical protein